MIRAREILQEAWRNVSGGTARGGWLALALLVTTLLLTTAEAVAVGALEASAAEFHRAGGSVRVIEAEAGIDPIRCEALSSVAGLGTSGALRAVPPIAVRGLPGVSTPGYETTVGLQSLLGTDRTLDAGVLLPEPLATRWNLTPGDTLETDRGPLPIAAVFPYPENDGRDTRLANAILLPVLSEGRFDECWADVWPTSTAFDSLLRTSLSATGDGVAPIGTLNPTAGQSFDGAEDYEERVTRFAPAVAALAGLVIGIVGGLRRRLEHASALHAGVSPRSLALIALAENMMCSVPAAITAAAGSALFARLNVPSVAGTLLPGQLTVAACALLGTACGALIVVAGTRESRLFRYFKDRG